MKARTFTVPFAKVVGDEATELEFGPDDYLVVRPIFSMSAIDIRSLTERIDAFESKVVERKTSKKGTADLNTEAGELVLALFDIAVKEWHLTGESGPIERPRTVKALDDLPGAIRGSLYSFLCNYRGDAAHPTPLN